jgi:hypothetical protein
MMEQLITFETAKLAKERGFDEESIMGYKEDGELMTIDRSEASWFAGASINFKNSDLTGYNKQFNDDWICICIASSQSLLQKWLREKHNIHININKIYECSKNPALFNGWIVYIAGKTFETSYKINEYFLTNYFKTYEEALEEGLYQVLELIKDGSNKTTN